MIMHCQGVLDRLGSFPRFTKKTWGKTVEKDRTPQWKVYTAGLNCFSRLSSLVLAKTPATTLLGLSNLVLQVRVHLLHSIERHKETHPVSTMATIEKEPATAEVEAVPKATEHSNPDQLAEFDSKRAAKIRHRVDLRLLPALAFM